MKKMSFKKVMAAVAAMSLAACAAAIPASAAANGVTIEIDQKTMTVDELAAMNYQVPIYVTLTDNAGINAAEFGVEVDSRCTFEVYAVSKKAQSVGGEALDWKMTFESNGQLTWQTWADSTVDDYSENIIMYLVTVPEAEAVPGAKFEINYVEESSKLHIWNNGIDGVNHVAAGTVDWTDGFIEIEGAETTTTTEETTTTTTEETTTTTTEETTTTTEETTTTTEETTTTTTEATTTTTAATTTTTAAPTTTTTPGKGSPATADATDILPIVGVAAAAAILGGVAIVSKKKDEE